MYFIFFLTIDIVRTELTKTPKENPFIFYGFPLGFFVWFPNLKD